jgi:hypothetical protein
MKKIILQTGFILFITLCCCLFVSGQGNPSSPVLIRQDTVVWDIPANVSERLLRAIETGIVKTVDYFTGKAIPANKIYTWRMGTDTVARYDSNENMKYEVIQLSRKPGSITRLQVVQSWYWNAEKGELFSRVNRIELIEELRDASGFFRGYTPLCRINY